MDILSNVFEFLVITVGLKMIVGHYIAEAVMKFAQKEFEKTERHQTLWQHYLSQVRGEGHQLKDVTRCYEGKCASL